MIKKLIRKLLYKNDTDSFWKAYKKAQGGSLISAIKCRRRAEKYGAYIPVTRGIQRFETPHQFYGIFISQGTVMGSGCTVFQQVTIGSNTLADSDKNGSPVIGDNVYIGAGAKIIGNVTIGSNVRIGANCVVFTDVPDGATVVLQKPRIIEHTEKRDNTFFYPKSPD